jgi:hypothetical protein
LILAAGSNANSKKRSIFGGAAESLTAQRYFPFSILKFTQKKHG